MDNSDKTI